MSSGMNTIFGTSKSQVEAHKLRDLGSESVTSLVILFAEHLFCSIMRFNAIT